ncbi:MAG TPA: prepilin-type N-terminal cleavage/methylation domain-containing protein, partial [Firmicutes bacterium]|nr:prepilin-type N-terminal cleavage/methylation domain-containing protein [Bacillota bacterium]
MIKGLLADERGLTLVELLITLTITGLMLSGVFAFYIFGSKVFNTGTEKAELQHGLRQAAEIITREVRFATELETVTGVDNPEVGRRYILMKEGPGEEEGGEGRIVLLDQQGETEISSGIPITGLTFNLDGKMLDFELKCAGKRGEYSIKSKVWLFNT